MFGREQVPDHIFYIGPQKEQDETRTSATWVEWKTSNNMMLVQALLLNGGVPKE